MGFGALKEFDPRHGGIKSMHAASSHRRKGVAAAALDHILKVARDRGYRRLTLETVSMEAFAPARALYARFGFKPCGPFADHGGHLMSGFMTLKLVESEESKL